MSKDVKCPICGSVEKGLNLDETDGWFVCSKCKSEVCNMEDMRTVKIPVYTDKQLTEIFGGECRKIKHIT